MGMGQTWISARVCVCVSLCAEPRMPSPTSSCSRATSASFSSSISPGLRDARFLGGSRLSSWPEGWALGDS